MRKREKKFFSFDYATFSYYDGDTWCFSIIGVYGNFFNQDIDSLFNKLY